MAAFLPYPVRAPPEQVGADTELALDGGLNRQLWSSPHTNQPKTEWRRTQFIRLHDYAVQESDPGSAGQLCSLTGNTWGHRVVFRGSWSGLEGPRWLHTCAACGPLLEGWAPQGPLPLHAPHAGPQSGTGSGRCQPPKARAWKLACLGHSCIFSRQRTCPVSKGGSPDLRLSKWGCNPLPPLIITCFCLELDS